MVHVILLNDLELPANAGIPVQIPAKHSNRDLAGINLDLTVRGQAKVRALEKLFDEKIIDVSDPFVGRTYKGKIHLVQSSYQEGSPERHYVAEVREEDVIPDFNELEINGQAFKVLKYFETEDSPPDRYALLKLTRSESAQFTELIQKPTLSLKRIGIDPSPVTVRPGGNPFWSNHEEDGSSYFKQLIRFFPPEDRTTGLDLASGHVQENLLHLIRDVTVRFEALVKLLMKLNILSEVQSDLILRSEDNDLIDKKLYVNLYWESRRVDDAEDLTRSW